MSGMTDVADRLDALAAECCQTTDSDYLARLANGHLIASDCADFIREHGAEIAARLRGDGEQGKVVRALPATARAPAPSRRRHERGRPHRARGRGDEMTSFDEAIAVVDGIADMLADSDEQALADKLGSALDTLRQLAEQRAELLEALRQIAALPAHPMRKKSVEIAERAIANATQQRNATGGEE